MARIASKTLSPKLDRTTGNVISNSKRGRPFGSKNRVPAEPTKATRAAARTASARKAVPGTPKLSKAELKAQLVKLERAVSRLREQNKKLKRLVREDAEAAELAAAAPKPTRFRTRAAAALKIPRTRSSKPVPHDAAAPATQADAEDHEAAA